MFVVVNAQKVATLPASCNYAGPNAKNDKGKYGITSTMQCIESATEVWTRIDKGQRRNQRATSCLTQATEQDIYKAKRKTDENRDRRGRSEGEWVFGDHCGCANRKRGISTRGRQGRALVEKGHSSSATTPSASSLALAWRISSFKAGRSSKSGTGPPCGHRSNAHSRTYALT